MKCPIFCSLGFSVGNVIFNEKVSLTNSMGDTNSRELASPTELVSSSHSRVDELPLSSKLSDFSFSMPACNSVKMRTLGRGSPFWWLL